MWRWWWTKQLWIPTAFISPDSNERPNRKDEILLTFFGRVRYVTEIPSIYFKMGTSHPASAETSPSWFSKLVLSREIRSRGKNLSSLCFTSKIVFFSFLEVQHSSCENWVQSSLWNLIRIFQRIHLKFLESKQNIYANFTEKKLKVLNGLQLTYWNIGLKRL